MKRTDWIKVIICGLTILIMVTLVVPWRYSFTGEKQSADAQNAHSLALALYQYAVDHGGKYPEGKTSTEIFQQLLDSDYIYDGGIFYRSMPGKVRITYGSKALKPENVSWDITCEEDADIPDHLPFVFLTGYKVTYQPGARTVPLHEASYQSRWSMWWRGENAFLAIAWKEDNQVCARIIAASSDGSIPDFIPNDFDPKGKVYRQLTPDGELTP